MIAICCSGGIRRAASSVPRTSLDADVMRWSGMGRTDSRLTAAQPTATKHNAPTNVSLTMTEGNRAEFGEREFPGPTPSPAERPVRPHEKRAAAGFALDGAILHRHRRRSREELHCHDVLRLHHG